jgi:membrane-associated phospholipid phosphatase
VTAALHTHPPMTLRRVGDRHRWLLPAALTVFVMLGTGALLDALPWDRPVTNFLVNLRTPWLDEIVRQISFLGSTRVVILVAALAALASWKRCPRLALAIIIIALARPLIEFTFKEIVDRPRPVGDRLVPGNGPSFPSGHPLATAASWCLLPLVVALYTTRRWIWWAVSISVWSLAVLVAASRVWLGVHWTSDVVAALALAVLGVALAERFISATHGGCELGRSRRLEAEHVDLEMVEGPVL